ncbi:MAG: hypothetical protein ACTHK7_18050, partial [Aureliella sp.]
NFGDTWALDYILLPDQPGQDSLSALAATISPAHMAEIEATCSDLGIQLNRVLARPVEIARWGIVAGGLATTEVSMIIALSQGHADLLLASLGSLVQIRSTRLPEDPAQAINALVAEIRRSMLAAASYVSQRPVTKILVIAAPDIAERAEATISQATGASVAIIDPATMLPSSLPERHEIAQRAASRLAAIAGVLTNPSPDKREVIDLKNFKRREPKKSKKQQQIMVGSAAGVLALLGGFWWWSVNASLDADIETARQTEAQTKELAESGMKFINHRKDVDNFLGGAINWLDELSYVATKLPPAEEVMVGEPAMMLLPGNTGQINFKIQAKDAQTIARVQEVLTDKDHAVSGSTSQELPSSDGPYHWTGQESIRVTTKGWDPLPPKSKAGARPAATPRGPAQPAAQAPAPAAAPAQAPTPAPSPSAGAPPAAATPTAETPAAEATTAAPQTPSAAPVTAQPSSERPATEPTSPKPAPTEPATTEPATTEPARSESAPAAAATAEPQSAPAAPSAPSPSTQPSAAASTAPAAPTPAPSAAAAPAK